MVLGLQKTSENDDLYNRARDQAIFLIENKYPVASTDIDILTNQIFEKWKKAAKESDKPQQLLNG